jgi:hypothetical protein
MTKVVISKEIASMWHSYQRLCSVWHTLEKPETEIDNNILNLIFEDPSSPMAICGNYLKFMLSNQKDGVVFPPTEETFRNWYNGKAEN